jgi:hypothetical protein
MWRGRLKELSVKVARTEYGSPGAVETDNAAADGLRELIRTVGCSSSGDLDELLSFLNDPDLRGWIAYGVLEQCTTSPTQRKRCVAVIQELARDDGPDGLAAQWWLRDHGEAS